MAASPPSRKAAEYGEGDRGCQFVEAMPGRRSKERYAVAEPGRRTQRRAEMSRLAPPSTSGYVMPHSPRRRGPMQRFSGTDSYVATPDLEAAVNAAIALERPLLVKGEPGTGKTILAHEIARGIGARLIAWHIKSTTKAQQGLYEYDAVARLRDGQLGDARVHDIRNYIVPGKLWEAFAAEQRPVLLIDEIDKGDIEFPNDLLLELDRMEFYVYETRETIRARHRPVVVITSNNEKELPDAFLRRCFFHYIRFPDRETMQKIVDVHFPGLKHDLVHEALTVFFELREVPGLKKKPSTSELLDWLKLLLVEDVPPEALRAREPAKLIPPLYGALLKNEEDVHLFERLAFLHRRGERG
jgi:MoxR-like ATPase